MIGQAAVKRSQAESGGKVFSAITSVSAPSFLRSSGEAEVICAMDTLYIKNEKPYIKLRFSAKQRLVAWRLGVYGGERLTAWSPLCRFIRRFCSFCCFLPTLSNFFAYYRFISHNYASYGVEVGHG